MPRSAADMPNCAWLCRANERISISLISGGIRATEPLVRNSVAPIAEKPLLNALFTSGSDDVAGKVNKMIEESKRFSQATQTLREQMNDIQALLGTVQSEQNMKHGILGLLKSL